MTRVVVVALVSLLLFAHFGGASRAASPGATNNDLIGNAIVVSSAPASFDVNTAGFLSGEDPADPEVECGGQAFPRQSHTAWYKLTPASAGQFTAAVTSTDDSVDTVIALWTNVGGHPGTLVACNDDDPSSPRPVDAQMYVSRIPKVIDEAGAPLNLSANQPYFLEVMSYQKSIGGPLHLAVTYTGLLAPNPVPHITTLTPSGHPVTNAAFAIDIAGTSFVAGAKVTAGASELVPASITATLIKVSIPAALATTPGTVSITVTNPVPGGGASNALPLRIYAVPTLLTVSPTMVTRGEGPFVLELTGSAFEDGLTTATIAGVARSLAVADATHATMTLEAADLAVLGDRPVIVINALGGGPPAPSSAVPVFVRSRADVNCDRSITGADALLLQRIVAGLAEPIAGCGTNADGLDDPGAPDLRDALYVRQVVAELIPAP